MAPLPAFKFLPARDLFTVLAPSCFEAREEFRRLVDLLQWHRRAHAISSLGPAGEELTIDVAFSTEQQDLPTLIVSSGLHGVEGFFGANVQLHLLHNIGSQELNPRGVRLVLIHALNPYGFAHVRRFDAENIDPNRNFLLPGEDFRGAPAGYAELDSLLNPRSPQSVGDCFQLRAGLMVLRHGLPKLKQAIATGQYEFPQGLFFGGHQPCETQRILQRHLSNWLAGAQRVVHFDLHTGLGKRGSAKLLLDSPLTGPQKSWLDQHLSSSAYEACNSAGVAYAARGGFGPWCVKHSGVQDYLFACAEFGTYSPLRVLAGLRAENREHHWGRPGSMSYDRAKRQLRERFDPGHGVLWTANRWVRQAIVGLAD